MCDVALNTEMLG